MFFILLTFLSAILLEGLGSIVSVIGISLLFGGNLIIIALAIALDIAKVVTVSLLYTHWKTLSKLMKTYALLAAAVTMTITSSGAAGYLAGEFQKAILGTKEGDLKVAVMKEQQAKYQERKKQIDDQIANLPAKTTVNQRLRLMNGFKAEQKELDQKISQIDKDLPAMQVQQIGTEAKAGPIVAVSKAFKIPVEEAIWYVIGMIIFVFDPLAVFLIIAGNFLWAQRKAQKTPPKTDKGDEPDELPADKFDGDPEPDEPSPDKQTVSHQAGDKFPIAPVEGQTFYRTDLKRLYVYLEGNWFLWNPTDKQEAPEAPDEQPASVVIEPTPEPIIAEAPSQIDTGPVTDEAKPARPEITRSSLGLTPADPHTIVNAAGSWGSAPSVKNTYKNSTSSK